MVLKSIPLLVGLLATACATGESVFGQTEWIVDGTREHGAPAVVFVNNLGGALCTGTIISPRVVLTAKHCVQNQGEDAPSPLSDFEIGVGDSVHGVTRVLTAADIRTTPGIWNRGPGGIEGALLGQDIALITLESSAEVEPIPIRRSNPVALTGRQAVAIGFGQTPDGEIGTKYRTTTTVRQIRGAVVYTDPITCQGDSGGPLIDVETGELFAVASFGSEACGSGIAGANRVDLYLEMIDEVVGLSGACVNDGPEHCDGFDNDCDDQVDEGCLDIGTACVSSDTCAGNNCADTTMGRICTLACDPLSPELGCPPGLFCAVVSGCEGQCLPHSGSRSLGIGEPCAEDTQCASLFCVDPGDGARRCLQPCRSGDGRCLAGEACAANVGQCGGCVPEEILPAVRRLGEPCADDESCASNHCLHQRGTSYCTAECLGDGECPDGFRCRGGETSVCVRGNREGVGGGCLDDRDCVEALVCASRAEARWCTAFCGAGNPCPDDFECVPAGGASICAPLRALVGQRCGGPEDCISGMCTATDDESRCTRLCGPPAPCAPGFECQRTADGLEAVCVDPSPEREPAGGCACAAAGPMRGGSTPRPLQGIGGLVLLWLGYRVIRRQVRG